MVSSSDFVASKPIVLRRRRDPSILAVVTLITTRMTESCLGRVAAIVPGDGAGIGGGEEDESIDKILLISCHESVGNHCTRNDSHCCT